MITVNSCLRVINNIVKKELCSCKGGRYIRTSTRLLSSDISQTSNTDSSAVTPPPTVFKGSAVVKPIATFRTSESNPAKHTIEHEARFYTVPEKEHAKYYVNRALGSYYTKQVKTFNEFCIMVRKPALEIMGYLKQADYSHPVIRYVLYGREGGGKSMTICHLLHYGAMTDWVIINVPWIPGWTRVTNSKTEFAPSSFRPGRVDQPYEGLYFLQRFKAQNSDLVQKLQLTTTSNYVWSKRESTEQGTPLMALVDHGINRAKFSCDVVGALLKEIKLQSTQNKCKTLVLLDGINAAFQVTRHKHDNKTPIRPEELTLVHHARDLIKNDWTNGAVVTAVDTIASPTEGKESWLPRYLLQKEGFELLDPFVPIRVNDYSEKEINSCLDYYLDRKWIQHEGGSTPTGRDELIFLSAYNPDRLMKLTEAW